MTLMPLEWGVATLSGPTPVAFVIVVGFEGDEVQRSGRWLSGCLYAFEQKILDHSSGSPILV